MAVPQLLLILTSYTLLVLAIIAGFWCLFIAYRAGKALGTPLSTMAIVFGLGIDIIPLLLGFGSGSIHDIKDGSATYQEASLFYVAVFIRLVSKLSVGYGFYTLYKNLVSLIASHRQYR